MITSLSKMQEKLIKNVKFYYHVSDIMKRSNTQKKLHLYPHFSHLYLSQMKRKKFSEKQAFFVTLQLLKCRPDMEFIQIIIGITHKNIQNITSFQSISTILVMCYELKYKNKQVLTDFAERGFYLFQKNIEQRFMIQGYTLTRFLIAVSDAIGLQKFPDQYYQMIDSNKIKPLFIVYILQLFWRSNNQNRPIVKYLLNSLLQKQKYIPFADVHHLIMTKRHIKDQKYIDLTTRLQERMSNKVSANNETEKKISDKVVETMFQQYVKDLNLRYF